MTTRRALTVIAQGIAIGLVLGLALLVPTVPLWWWAVNR